MLFHFKFSEVDVVARNILIFRCDKAAVSVCWSVGWSVTHSFHNQHVAPY